MPGFFSSLKFDVSPTMSLYKISSLFFATGSPQSPNNSYLNLTQAIQLQGADTSLPSASLSFLEAHQEKYQSCHPDRGLQDQLLLVNQVTELQPPQNYFQDAKPLKVHQEYNQQLQRPHHVSYHCHTN